MGVLLLLQGGRSVSLAARETATVLSAVHNMTLTELLPQRLAAQLGRVELEFLWVWGVEAAAPDGQHFLVTIRVMLAVRTYRHYQTCVTGWERAAAGN